MLVIDVDIMQNYTGKRIAIPTYWHIYTGSVILFTGEGYRSKLDCSDNLSILFLLEVITNKPNVYSFFLVISREYLDWSNHYFNLNSQGDLFFHLLLWSFRPYWKLNATSRRFKKILYCVALVVKCLLVVSPSKVSISYLLWP